MKNKYCISNVLLKHSLLQPFLTYCPYLNCHFSKIRMEAPKLTNLFKVVNGFRYFGAGCKVTRSIYKFPDTYWIVSRVKLSKDQDHGAAYGRLVWRGKPQGHDRRIHSARKGQWSLVDTPDYTTYKGSEGNHEELVTAAEAWFADNGTWVNPPEKSEEKTQA